LGNKKLEYISINDVSDVTQKQENSFSMLLGFVTHELKNPLGIVLAILNTLKDKVCDILKTEVLTALSALFMQEKLIDDILDLVKILHKKLVLHISSVKIRDVLKNIFELFRYKLSEKISFRMNIDPEVPDILSIDEKRYQQITYNLLSNSSKFTT